MKIIPFLLPVTLLAFGCTTSGSKGVNPSFPVAKGTVEAGTTVKRGGTPMKLSKGELEVGDRIALDGLVGSDMGPARFAGDGKVRLVSIVPSIDTKVCEEQTHILGESTGISPKVERVTISRDLPFAQKRFATEAGLTNVTYFSDFKDGAFGKSHGLLIPDMGLLARAVMVVDQKGVVRHLQIVPDVTQLPDMKRAIQVANELAMSKVMIK